MSIFMLYFLLIMYERVYSRWNQVYMIIWCIYNIIEPMNLIMMQSIFMLLDI